jgi:hypothetical protein
MHCWSPSGGALRYRGGAAVDAVCFGGWCCCRQCAGYAWGGGLVMRDFSGRFLGYHKPGVWWLSFPCPPLCTCACAPALACTCSARTPVCGRPWMCVMAFCQQTCSEWRRVLQPLWADHWGRSACMCACMCMADTHARHASCSRRPVCYDSGLLCRQGATISRGLPTDRPCAVSVCVPCMLPHAVGKCMQQRRHW